MDQDYGLWPLVIINSVLLIAFAGSFFHPRSKRDWHAMGAYSAFIVALFTEMYGLPLTIYLLSGWLGSRFPALQATHSGGHLWNDLIGWQGDPHVSPFHLASYAVLLAGFWLIAAAWTHLLRSAREDRLATTGPYAWVRHPQYLGFLAIMVGFLLQWPTLPTLVMFPVLVYVYWRLARTEERGVAARYPDEWPTYAAGVHRLRPRRPSLVPPTPPPAGQAGPRSIQKENHHAHP
ncbi:isoprenylcysteine carboxylmethyltransferase family protein [Knoellia locipacati]|uniref:methyltransferase family protein n=1 Tax=Knoellia locipacati TaxID=882824 RepID=UPI00384C7D42